MKQDIEKKYPYDCFAVTIYQSLLDGISVSIFLCTRKAEEVQV